ncbi:hypothetical protein Tco_0954176 [Tanacetum coccineum]|uniref:Uncharacterized protein n=1 Tax=Tanacetum coccineum TaxID=301880 RepID=A0ABQ5E1Z3_9ASTR
MVSEPGWASGGVDGVPSVRPRFNDISGSRIVAIVEGEAHGGLGLRGGLLGLQTQSHIGRIIILKLTYKPGGLLLLSLICFRMEPQLGLYVRLGEILGLRFPTIGIRALSNPSRHRHRHHHQPSKKSMTSSSPAILPILS